MNGPVAPRVRLGYLDGVRALAAGYVVLHHIWLTIWPDYPVNTGPTWVAWLLHGQLAVAVFIVVSGFSLALEPLRHGQRLSGGTRRFFRRRAWRILPPYWAALVLSSLVILLVTGPLPAEAVTFKGFVVHASLLQDLIGSATPNGAFWSIAIEWQIYFLFPLLLWWRRRYGLTPTVVTTTAVVTVAYLASVNIDALRKIQDVTPQFLVLFVFGMAAAEIMTPGNEARRARTPWCLLAGLGALALVGYAVVAGSAAVVEHYFWIDLAAGACTAFLLAGLADERPRRLRSVLGGRVLRSLGRFSYSTYLVHLPILSVVWLYVVDPMGLGAVEAFLTMAAIGVPAVYAGSYLFSAVFEQPFVRHRSFRDLVAATLDFAGRLRSATVPHRA